MPELKIWFLDVGHGDCAFIQLPHRGRIMIDCGCGPNNWPSTLLKRLGASKNGQYPISIPNESTPYGIDNLVITHPHGDHIADLKNIRDEIGFYMFTGGYSNFLDQLTVEQVDFKKRGQEAARVFFEVVRHYTGTYDANKDNVVSNVPICLVEKKRFIDFTPGMDLNELSWFVSLMIGGHKVLFTGDMTATGVRKILQSNRAAEFAEFVKGTTILKVPHHGRDNGCSSEMFELFGRKPLACIASDEVLNERNEGTSNIGWYSSRTSDQRISVDGVMDSRKVFTTRTDKDVELVINEQGQLAFRTKVFAAIREELEVEKSAAQARYKSWV